MQGPSRRPGVKDSVAQMVGGAGAAELWVPGGFLTGGGHQGRCRAILRPGAGSRVDPARWAASPSRFLPHPEGRACHFSPRPSWPPPSLPVPLSGPLLTTPPVSSAWKACFWTTSPSALSSLPSVTLLRTCRAVWLRRCPLVCCLALLVCDPCVCVHARPCVHACAHACARSHHWLVTGPVHKDSELRKRRHWTAPRSPQDQAVSLLVGTGSCAACWSGWGSHGGPGAALSLPQACPVAPPLDRPAFPQLPLPPGLPVITWFSVCLTQVYFSAQS